MNRHHLDSSDHLICENCGKMLDGAVSQDESILHPPSEGDISLCAYCGEINVYKNINGKLGLAPMPVETMEKLIVTQPMDALALLAARQKILLRKHRENEP